MFVHKHNASICWNVSFFPILCNPVCDVIFVLSAVFQRLATAGGAADRACWGCWFLCHLSALPAAAHEGTVGVCVLSAYNLCGKPYIAWLSMWGLLPMGKIMFGISLRTETKSPLPRLLRPCRKSCGTWPSPSASNKTLQPQQQLNRSTHTHIDVSTPARWCRETVCLVKCVWWCLQILEETYKLEFLYRGLDSRQVATIHHVRLQAKALQLILTARTRKGSVRTQTPPHAC